MIKTKCESVKSSFTSAKIRPPSRKEREESREKEKEREERERKKIEELFLKFIEKEFEDHAHY